jgi:1-acyl-sn-glycerol-3-phosphate acyltransferase
MRKTSLGHKLLLKSIQFLTKIYFRPITKGRENIPKGPCLFVGNHNAIVALCPEIWIFASYYFPQNEDLKVLGHDLVLRVPGLAFFARKYLHYIPNNIKSAQVALERGHQVLVYPGGGWESCRPSKDRDQINFNNRSGFIELARSSNIPIVPIVSTGAHDGVYIWTRGEKLAKGLGLKRLFRIDTFPLGLSFPFLFHIGPLFPFIPLPKKVILEIMPPVSTQSLEGSTNQEKASSLISSMQEAMNRNVTILRES